jgi:basic amino acid/polyamine antiporter, APA family
MATLLNRTLTLSQITLYGLGTILGAGIYVLLGEVALVSGNFTPVAFIVAAIVVSFSAYSYRHLARRFPYSAGEPVYIQEAFGSIKLSRLVGLTIVFAGIVSAATITRGFVGYFALVLSLPDVVIITLLIVCLTALASWGVRQSVAVAVATTVVELAGIALVIWASFDSLPSLLQQPQLYLLPDSTAAWSGIAAGAFIAFYAFIGFEDMVNMAEEVVDPEKNLFRGIILALVITTVLYLVVALCAVSAVPMTELAGATAPLALIIERNTIFPVHFMAAISMVAIINGALLQVIMCARVLYGMAKQRMIPAILARVHHRTQTPVITTILVGSSVFVFAVLLPIATLAKTTSTLILAVFTLVNASLFRLNWRADKSTLTQLCLPGAGIFVSVTFLILQFVTNVKT